MSVIGLRVGPFEIVEPCTVPEEGDWYRAKRAGMSQRKPLEVLVKLLAPDADGRTRAALQVEFDNLRAVEDPRIPHAVALYEGVGALTIEAPDGVSLQDITEARHKGTVAMTPPTLLELGLELAETLQHAHHRSRHHGHLEPTLIRLTTSGKLIFFGFSTGPSTDISAPWVPPERARNEPTSPATDQWSLAAILAGLISGRPPWSEANPALRGQIEPIVEPVERQWPALARLFRRMLDPDPNNRYPSMHPVRQEMLALARKARGTSELRELGRLMARRVKRQVQPDPESEAPAEFVVDTFPGEPSSPPDETPPDPDQEVQAPEPSAPEPPLPDQNPDSASPPEDTVPEPGSTAPLTPPADALDPPTIPQLTPITEPAEAPRLGHDLTPSNPAPLPHETFKAVQPSVHPDDVPEAPLQSAAVKLTPEPTLSTLSPIQVTDDEDVSDAPTERFDPLLARKLAMLLDEPEPDFETSEVRFASSEVAAALAVPSTGDAPTAIPITDVSDEDGPEEPVSELSKPEAPPPADRPPLEEAEINIDSSKPLPSPPAVDAPDFEVQQTRAPAVPEPSPAILKRIAPALGVLAIVLMLIFTVLKFWPT